jgi:hypothetical protein
MMDHPEVHSLQYPPGQKISNNKQKQRCHKGGLPPPAAPSEGQRRVQVLNHPNQLPRVVETAPLFVLGDFEFAGIETLLRHDIVTSLCHDIDPF